MGIPEIAYIELLQGLSGGVTVPSTNAAGRAFPPQSMLAYELSWMGPALLLWAILREFKRSSPE
jgi:hypothetical protein